MTHTPDDDDFVPLLEISASFTKEELLSKLDAAKKEKARADACVNACAGIPTNKLTPGVVKRLVEAAQALSERAELAAQFLSLVAHGAAGDAAAVKAAAPKSRNLLRQQCEVIDAILRELGSE